MTDSPPWVFRRTSSAPESDFKVKPQANLSNRRWRPHSERDILALSSLQVEEANAAGAAARHHQAASRMSGLPSKSSSLPPSPLLPPQVRAAPYGSCVQRRMDRSFSTCSSFDAMHSPNASPCMNFASPSMSSFNFRVPEMEDDFSMREGARSAMSDFSDFDVNIVPQGGDCGDWHEERAGNTDIVVSIRSSSISQTMSEGPEPLPGYSRVHFIFAN